MFNERRVDWRYRWLVITAASVLYAFLSYATAGIEVGDTAHFRPAIAILAVTAAIFGPVTGFFVGFLGNMGVDLLLQDIWWHWSVANGIIGFITGLLYVVPGYQPRQGQMLGMHLVMFVVLAAAGNYTGLTLAALLDVMVSETPFQEAIFGWAVTPATSNVLLSSVLGIPLLYGYVVWKRIQISSVVPCEDGDCD
ncbi:ECF transporter S component [Brevibacillus humidisoli]|uniref:ECF transporter S component n=1 Tax=Brevibacillus humidisoli TaxID=2895522 RepID=UPI001E3C24A3|nr:ECF transporter S component [Brevibacillus humidisoli]UFJ39423.1 ECF transporter S component [Brevibacillus humidisoli]